MEKEFDPNNSDGGNSFDEDENHYPGYVIEELETLLKDTPETAAAEQLGLPVNSAARLAITQTLARLDERWTKMRSLRLRLQLRTALSLKQTCDFSIDRKGVRHCTEVLQERVYKNFILKNVFLANLTGSVVRKRLMPKPMMIIGPDGTGKFNFCLAAADGLDRAITLVELYADDNSIVGPAKFTKNCCRFGKQLLIVIAYNGINRLVSYDKPGNITNSFLSRYFYDPFLGYPIDIEMIPKIALCDHDSTAAGSRFSDFRPAHTELLNAEEKIYVANNFLIPNLLAEAKIKAVINFDPTLVEAVVLRHAVSPGMNQIRSDLEALVAVAGFRVLRTGASVIGMRPIDIRLIADNSSFEKTDAPKSASPASRNENIPPEFTLINQ